MLGLEQGIGHGRMAAPAKKSYIGPELYILGFVSLRIWCIHMADDTDRLSANDFFNFPIFIKHVMRIQSFITHFVMALETNIPLLEILPFPQKISSPCFMITKMAGGTGYLSICQRKRNFTERLNIDGMMIQPIIVAFNTVGIFIIGLVLGLRAGRQRITGHHQ